MLQALNIAFCNHHIIPVKSNAIHTRLICVHIVLHSAGFMMTVKHLPTERSLYMQRTGRRICVGGLQ
jgi:hypothetical protein